MHYQNFTAASSNFLRALGSPTSPHSGFKPRALKLRSLLCQARPRPTSPHLGFNPRALKLRSCCAHPLSVRRMSGPSCCPSLVCFVLFCVGFCVPLWCSAPHPAPSNLRPCAALINLLRLLQQIWFPSAHGIGSRLRRMTLCVVGKGPNVSLSHRWYPRTTSSTPLRAVSAHFTSRR